MKKNNFKILVTEDIHQIFFDELASANILVDDRLNINSRDELKALLPLYDGMLVRSKFFVDEDLISGAKNLKLIARAGAGMDNIDEVYCLANGITLINAPEGNRDAVAEHVIGMLLNLMRNISKSNAEIKNGIWLREENRGIEVGGKTIGIIGYGNTGKALAKKLSGFGVQVIAYDKYLTNYSDQFAQAVSLNELQNSADIISIHVPLNVEGMRDAMPILFELLEGEPEASVRAVLGHFVFVFIHPYMDGNGRIGRFLMNAMLASGGYPWTVIPLEKRDEYMQALESASVDQNIEPFTKFIGILVSDRISGKGGAELPDIT